MAATLGSMSCNAFRVMCMSVMACGLALLLQTRGLLLESISWHLPLCLVIVLTKLILLACLADVAAHQCPIDWTHRFGSAATLAIVEMLISA